MKNTLQDLLTAIGSNERLQECYASKKCKECVGRGWKQIITPSKNHIPKKYNKLKKKQKLYIRNNLDKQSPSDMAKYLKIDSDIVHHFVNELTKNRVLCHCILKKAKEELKDG